MKGTGLLIIIVLLIINLSIDVYKLYNKKESYWGIGCREYCKHFGEVQIGPADYPDCHCEKPRE